MTQNPLMKVSLVTVAINLLLSLLKLVCGLFAHSAALISDAVHSASDVFSTFLVMAGVTMASKASDKEHQYGHERMESLVALLLSIILAAVGGGIGIDGAGRLFSGQYQPVSGISGGFAMGAALLSIATKEWMYHYTKKAAKALHSDALMADAWHHRSDALSSIGSFAGILGAELGVPALDSIACLVICVFILKAAFDIGKDACNKLIDRFGGEETENAIRKTVSECPGVLRIDSLKTRLFGAKLYVDLEIAVDDGLSVREAHDIAQTVHDLVEKEFTLTKHCMVHVNPYQQNK